MKILEILKANKRVVGLSILGLAGAVVGAVALFGKEEEPAAPEVQAEETKEEVKTEVQ